MKYFIGIVPPGEIYKSVVNIQNKFGDNRLEPHITLRPPVTVTNEHEWINAIEIVCSNFSPIEIALPATGNFGTGVLFIEVLSETLQALQQLLSEAIKPFEKQENQQQENQSYHPHLTLARAWCGFTQQDFAAMKILATEYLIKQPVSFKVTFVRIYYKPEGSKRHLKLKDVQLNNPL